MPATGRRSCDLRCAPSNPGLKPGLGRGRLDGQTARV
jgi:hypothetical protein